MLLHDDIARKHGADLVLELERAISELWVASSENPVGTKILAELRLHGRRDVDIGEDAKAFVLQRFDHPGDGLIEGKVEALGEVVAHRHLREER